MSHCNSQDAKERDLYSASEELLDTVCCFLARQEINEEPKKKQYPEVDLLVSMQLAQSASAKPRSCNDDCLEKNRPRPGEPL
ncbi:putative disease resistance protein (TIR-NBS-LRR class), partial [Trifolium medium]|nr:putative disease resistance protein (TIR-NBS-LRR class) [Trifolium medium]